MFTVYLAGYIHGKKIKKCIEWREKIKNYYKRFNHESHEICWLDPLNGKEIGEITPDGLKSNIPGSAFLPRDFMSVSNADLVVASLETFGQTRPPIGTISEIAWCYVLKKPLIVITDEIQYKEHPFIKYNAALIVPTVEDLLEKNYIGYFYKGVNNAIH